jgi:hypothetical protein
MDPLRVPSQVTLEMSAFDTFARYRPVWKYVGRLASEGTMLRLSTTSIGSVQPPGLPVLEPG